MSNRTRGVGSKKNSNEWVESRSDTGRKSYKKRYSPVPASDTRAGDRIYIDDYGNVEEFNLSPEDIEVDFLDSYPDNGKKLLLIDKKQGKVNHFVGTDPQGYYNVFEDISRLENLNETDYVTLKDEFQMSMDVIQELADKRKGRIKDSKKLMKGIKEKDPNIKRGFNLVEGNISDYPEINNGLSQEENAINNVLAQDYVAQMEASMEENGIQLDPRELAQYAYKEPLYKAENVYITNDGTILTKANPTISTTQPYLRGLRAYHTMEDHDVSFNNTHDYNEDSISTNAKSLLGSQRLIVDGKLNHMNNSIYDSVSANNTNNDYISGDTDTTSLSDKYYAWVTKRSPMRQSDVDHDINNSFLSNKNLGRKELEQVLAYYDGNTHLDNTILDKIVNHPSLGDYPIEEYVARNKSVAEQNSNKTSYDDMINQRAIERAENIRAGRLAALENPRVAEQVESSIRNIPAGFQRGKKYEVPVSREAREKLGDDYIESLMPDNGRWGTTVYDEDKQVYRRTYDNNLD